MAVSEFIETVEPKALEFLQGCDDPGTLAGAKVRTLTRSLEGALARWEARLSEHPGDPSYTEYVQDLRAKLETIATKTGAQNGR